jgi:hypothetical protein
MSELEQYQKYVKKVPTYLRPYQEGEDLCGIWTNPGETPSVGDYIESNPNAPEEKWLVGKEFFEAHYIPAPLEREEEQEETAQYKKYWVTLPGNSAYPAYLRPYQEGEDLSGVSVDITDKPSVGGYIAIDLNNPKDKQYVGKEFFDAYCTLAYPEREDGKEAVEKEEVTQQADSPLPRVSFDDLEKDIADVEYVEHVLKSGAISCWAVVTTKSKLIASGRAIISLSAENYNKEQAKELALKSAMLDLHLMYSLALKRNPAA